MVQIKLQENRGKIWEGDEMLMDVWNIKWKWVSNTNDIETKWQVHGKTNITCK